MTTRFGLTEMEWEKLNTLLERNPTDLEMQLFAALWSEHCSYKTSRFHLKRLPTEGDHILYGPGEGAGVVAIDEDTCCVFKMESHNHPSAVEPFQGAATGVGGIIRDVISMGARPVALLDCLRFGLLEGPNAERQRYLLEHVVKGISSYGNCIGVPTVGGDIEFDPCYENNPLVNVMAVGLCDPKAIIPSVAETGILVLYGSATGREGLGGAFFASQDLDQDNQENDRSAVQIGNPFMEKNLIEATMEIAHIGKKHGWLRGLQDLGAAGLMGAASEMAHRGNCRTTLYLQNVPLRVKDMEPVEILLSETQERMLMCVRDDEEIIHTRWQEILEKYNIPYAVVGKTCNYGNATFGVTLKNEELLELPISIFGEVPDREIKDMESGYRSPGYQSTMSETYQTSDYQFGSPSYIYDQFDHMVGTQTLIGPGEASAAVIQPHGKKWALGLTTSGLPPIQYNYQDRAEHMIAQCTRDLISVGAKPLAVTNCLNFASPKDPRVLHDLRSVIEGMRSACLTFNTPVTGGNVSLYNQTGEKGILPTPIVGMVGVIEDVEHVMRPGFTTEGHPIYIVGSDQWPQRGLGSLQVTNETVLEMIQQGWVGSCQSINHSGVLKALLKSASRGSQGFQVRDPQLFAKGHSYLLSIEPQSISFVKMLLIRRDVPFCHIGDTGGEVCKFGSDFEISLSAARENLNSSLAKKMLV